MLEISVYYRIKGENVECNPAYTESDRWSSSKEAWRFTECDCQGGNWVSLNQPKTVVW